MCSGKSLTVFICNVCVYVCVGLLMAKIFPQTILCNTSEMQKSLTIVFLLVFCSSITCDEDHSSPGKDMYGQINYSTLFFFF